MTNVLYPWIIAWHFMGIIPEQYFKIDHALPFTKWLSMHYFFLIYLIYLFLAALGLRCCVRAFSSCGERGLLFRAVRGLLIVVASLVAEHRL